MIEPMLRTLDVRRRDNPWTDSFGVTVDDVASDLSGYSARLQFRLYPGASDPALLDVQSSAATPNGSLIDMSAAFAGLITIKLARADLITLPGAPATPQPFAQTGHPATLAYDLLLTDPNGNEETWYYGPAIIWPGVTAHA